MYYITMRLRPRSCASVVGKGQMTQVQRTILGIDPGLANTGWGIVSQCGARLSCVAYGCISTSKDMPLAHRLMKIHRQMGAVIARFEPTCAGVETVWFGSNTQSAFATGQARGAALVACAERDLRVGEFSPSQIKLAVVGTGSADKDQVQYMVRQLLALEAVPRPDHAADALAAAICFTTHEGFADRARSAQAAGRIASLRQDRESCPTRAADVAPARFSVPSSGKETA